MSANRIPLYHRAVHNQLLDDSYLVGNKYMPSHVLYGATTRDAGAWSAFINDHPAYNLILKLASGGLIRTLTAAVYRRAHQASGLQDALEAFFAIALPQLAETIIPLGQRSYALIMRPHATILVLKEGIGSNPSDLHGRHGFYIPSPVASGHDLIADATLLDTDFPGCFELR